MSKTKEDVYRELHIPKDKEPFIFEYTKPWLDWYETIKVEIKPEDYYYFQLERRFGPTWWLIGCNPVDKPNYHWEYKELGEIGSEISNYDVKRFIEWAKCDNGSRIIKISVLSGSFDIFKDIDKIFFNNKTKQEYLANYTKQVRKEVCEKIRKYYTTPIYDRENAHTEVRVLLSRLDQIEQGEQSGAEETDKT